VTPRTTIFWFRRDLRLEDNPALVEAARDGYAPAMVEAALERNEALDRFAESRELAKVGP
jgi:deoxyribodipyrimidine photolyase